MPRLGRGTKCIKILLSQVSKDIQEPLVPMLFPILGAHISNTEFKYPDLSRKEPCGQMAHLVAENGGNKGQLSSLVEPICRDFRQHDEEKLRPPAVLRRTAFQKARNTSRPTPETRRVSPRFLGLKQHVFGMK